MGNHCLQLFVVHRNLPAGAPLPLIWAEDVLTVPSHSRPAGLDHGCGDEVQPLRRRQVFPTVRTVVSHFVSNVLDLTRRPRKRDVPARPPRHCDQQIVRPDGREGSSAGNPLVSHSGPTEGSVVPGVRPHGHRKVLAPRSVSTVVRKERQPSRLPTLGRWPVSTLTRVPSAVR